jgi:hypothetical protein
MNKLLINDKTLFCVSAWNDNGKKDVIKNDPGLLINKKKRGKKLKFFI